MDSYVYDASIISVVLYVKVYMKVHVLYNNVTILHKLLHILCVSKCKIIYLYNKLPKKMQKIINITNFSQNYNTNV